MVGSDTLTPTEQQLLAVTLIERVAASGDARATLAQLVRAVPAEDMVGLLVGVTTALIRTQVPAEERPGMFAALRGDLLAG